ncbi:MAG: recombinase family protein, partial [candidate division WWE3 bacterium]|nr:recombinase family protein [candidate division WWE3 bacterium]
MSNLRYIRYSRKSSEPKEKQALSIPEQNAECEKYAVTNNLNITYRLEESKSSFKPRIRPVFDQMLRLIENGAADAILAWAPNRLCRNPEEGGRILQLLQDGVLKEIRTTTGEAYTPESDHLVLQIHFGMANQYSRNISRDVRRSLIHKRERGEYPRMAPVGFDTFGEKGSRNLKPNILEAPLIRKVYEMAATGQMSLHYLSNWLFDSGLRTKKGKRISVSHLYRILTSPIYYGCFYSLGELYSGSYEPIVSKNLFDQVQVALGIRSKPRMNTWKYWTNGLVYCAECGCAITTTIKTKHYKETDRTATYLYNHCTHRKGGCHEHPIGADDFQQLLK